MAPTTTKSAAARPDPGEGKYLSARWLNRAMVLLCVAFALRHPLVAPYTTGERSVPADLSTAAASFANTTAALRVPAQRARVLAGWREYVLGSDTGDASDPVRAHFFAENEWKTSLFLWVLPAAVRDSLSHVVAIYVRNYIAIHLVYFGLGGIWAYLIYVVFADTYFPLDTDPRKPAGTRVGMPTRDAIRAQMWASVKAMHFYVLMPTMSEWFVERGLTRARTSIADMGGFEAYVLWTAAYLFFVEWAIYWIHRLLHEVRWAYKWLHHDHHIYNSVGDMSPFAGLAFHPLDGMLQASPYLVGLFLMPVHYWTHLGLLFFTGVWTSLIHDTLRSGTEPVMGSKYHMYHHTAYRDNYGQFFVLFDWIHGTLTDPLEKDPAHFGLVEAGAEKAADDGTMFAAAKAAAAAKAEAAKAADVAAAVSSASSASEGSARKRRGSVAASAGEGRKASR